MLFTKMNFRELKNGALRYLLLFLVIALGITLVVGLGASADSITTTVEEYAEKNYLEDGNFSVMDPLTESQINDAENEGLMLEPQFYVDMHQEDNSVIRIYQNRSKVNLVELDEGKQSADGNEIVLEKQYAKEHDLKVHSVIEVGGIQFIVVGIGSVPDYDKVLRNVTDMLAEAENFGVGFVTDSAYDQLKVSDKASGEEYSYSYILNESNTQKALKDYLQDIEDLNLTNFVPMANNPRIMASVEDVEVNKIFSMYFGVVYMLLMSYVISVFMSHNIEKNSRVIGTLYSMGHSKKTLLKGFLVVPFIVVLAGGVLGTGLGFLLIKPLGADAIEEFSFPVVQNVYSVGLILYGVVLPVIVTLIINYAILNKRLSAEPLRLIKKQRKQVKTSRINLRRLSFNNKFRIRQLIREKRSNVTLFLGLFFAIFLMVFGITVYTGITNFANDLGKDVPYNYMYILKYPPDDIPAGAAEGFAKTLDSYCVYADGDMSVTLQGISRGDKYFDLEFDGNENEIIISSSVASKFQWKKGDSVTLTDTIENKNYNFTVKDITQYGYGLYVFMDINAMRNLFDQSETFYNTLMSDGELVIEGDRVSSIITAADIELTGEKYLESMMDAVIVLLVVSIIIFIVIMFLLIKMIIDKSTFSISLLKVLGYHEKNVKKLYLGSNFYTVLVTGVIAVPVSKALVDIVFPYMVYNVAGSFNTAFIVIEYLMIAGIILASYFVSSLILQRYLKKVELAEILKERE